MSTFMCPPAVDLASLNICLVVSHVCIVPSGSSHDAASVFGPGLAAASDVVAHTKVVAHLMCHGCRDTHS